MADLITMLQAAAGQVGGDYQISRSLRFNSADSAYLSRTFGSGGNRKTWTWSGWVKRSAVGTGSQQVLLSAGVVDADKTVIRFDTDDSLRLVTFDSSVPTDDVRTTAVYRDVSAWYHIVVVSDTTQATASDRAKIYVNGVQVTSLQTSNYPTLNFDTDINSNALHTTGKNSADTNQYLGGYLAEVHFVDGQALTPSSFGETDAVTGVWKPKAYTGTYGTNGFHLDFSDNTSTTTLGYDAAGSNDWTLNNFSVTAGAGNDSLVDSPTRYGTDTGAGGEVRGNYATLNPLYKFPSAGVTLSNGNLNVASVANTTGLTHGTIGVTSGKYYFEMLVGAVGGYTDSHFAGWQIETPASVARGAYRSSGTIYDFAGSTTSGSTYTTNDIIGCAVDVDAGKVWFAKNNTWQNSGDPAAGTNEAFTFTAGTEVFPFIAFDSKPNALDAVANFGQRPFAYTAPSGFKALCTTNLPDPTIVEGNDYFNTVLYTGTGSSLGVTGVGFQPDFVWIKERSGAADHALYDAVRGVQQQLESNTTTDETTESTGLTAFGSDGFTVGSLAQVNTNTDTYVAWNWKESTISKFDIVTYTGNGTARTISHNLSVVPNMIIVKARTTASTDQGWAVYHSANTANPETDYLLLNSTAATADLDTVWNDTAPTSSVFSVGTNALVNANNDTYVAYLFANVEGFSKFGSYTGNGSADGPFVYTGFRPAFVIYKCTTNVENWKLFDSARDLYNFVEHSLSPNLSNAESLTTATYSLDFLSNGFKIRSIGGGDNASGATYIYMAFSQNPFKYSLAR